MVYTESKFITLKVFYYYINCHESVDTTPGLGPEHFTANEKWRRCGVYKLISKEPDCV